MSLFLTRVEKLTQLLREQEEQKQEPSFKVPASLFNAVEGWELPKSDPIQKVKELALKDQMVPASLLDKAIVAMEATMESVKDSKLKDITAKMLRRLQGARGLTDKLPKDITVHEEHRIHESRIPDKSENAAISSFISAIEDLIDVTDNRNSSWADEIPFVEIILEDLAVLLEANHEYDAAELVVKAIDKLPDVG